jgi:capsular exopolysaccharide synthesis family protein
MRTASGLGGNVSKIYDALKRAEREREVSRDRGVETNGRATATHHPPDESEEDDYRRLRASLLFTPSYSEVHTIIVTATRHGEGATRVAVGLAKALASEGDTRVLLVEANMRSPSLSRVLPLADGPGLSDYLAGEASPESLVKRLGDVNLSIVTAGDRPGMVDCEAIITAIAELTPNFDFVIIDAPPVNRYADVSVLGPKVDGVILVVQADETPVADAENAKRTLDRVGARIFGVVLNRQKSYVPATIQALL